MPLGHVWLVVLPEPFPTQGSMARQLAHAETHVTQWLEPRRCQICVVLLHSYTIGLLLLFWLHLDSSLVLLLKFCPRYSERVWIYCCYPTPLQGLCSQENCCAAKIAAGLQSICTARYRVHGPPLAAPLSDFMMCPLLVFFLLPLAISCPLPVPKV